MRLHSPLLEVEGFSNGELPCLGIRDYCWVSISISAGTPFGLTSKLMLPHEISTGPR